MLRTILIYLSKASWARKIVTSWGFARRAASRFIAGERVQDAINAVKVLNASGINATLDQLGENTTDPDGALRATDGILAMLDAIEEGGVRASVSIKLTQIGLALDEGICEANLDRILIRAKELNIFVRIDMEDSPWTEATLGLCRRMCERYGLENVGVVIQAYLYRSEVDVRSIAGQGGRIRLCKGAYQEPASIAFPEKQDVDQNYDKLAEILMDAAKMNGAPQISEDGRIPPIPCIATHDVARVAHAKAYAELINLPKKTIEFQMLYGIRRDLQEQLARQGYPVRVYVPYGTEWYPYFTRRLAERPANLWFFLSNLARS